MAETTETKEEIAVKRAFGERLKKSRRKKYPDKTAKEFYELLEKKSAQRGFKLPFGLIAYRQYENGTRMPTLYSMALLAHALDTSLDYLVGIYDKTSLVDVLKSQHIDAWIQDKDIHVKFEDDILKLENRTVRQIYHQAWKQVRENTENILRDALTEQYKRRAATGHNDSDEIVSRSICQFMGLDYENFFEALQQAIVNDELLLPSCFRTSSNALCFYYITGINPAEAPLRARQLLEFYSLIDSSRIDRSFAQNFSDRFAVSVLETQVPNYTDKRQSVLIELYERIYKNSYAWKPVIPFLNRYIIRYADIPLSQQSKTNIFKFYFLNMLMRFGDYPGPLPPNQNAKSLMSAIIADFENTSLFKPIRSGESKIKLINELRFQCPADVKLADLEKQFVTDKAKHGAEHEKTVLAFYALTHSLIENHDYDKAIELAKKEYGEQSICVATVFNMAAEECYDENYTQQGIAYATTALNSLDICAPDNEKMHIQYQDTLALLYSDTKEHWPKAKKMTLKQLKDISYSFPDANDLLGYEYYVLATILFKGDENEKEALSAAEKAFELLSTIPKTERMPDIQKKINNAEALLNNIRKWFEENDESDSE